MTLPECAVCGRPVEALEREYEMHTERIRFIAFCHGQAETAFLTKEQALLMTRFGMGRAFERPALPEQSTARLTRSEP